MIRSISSIAIAIAAVFLTSCSSSVGPLNASSQEGRLGHKRVNLEWWRQLNDPNLNQDIASAFSENPHLQEVALRIERANAGVSQARASGLPHVNLGFGYELGRREEVDFGPYDIPEWRSRAGLSWEIDVTGKLRAAQRAASATREAAVWDVHAARLLLASRIASTRLSLYRLNREIGLSIQLKDAAQHTLESLIDRSQAGLIPDSLLDEQRAEIERVKRAQFELERARNLAVVQLRTLRGGSNPSNTVRSDFPAEFSFSSRSYAELLSSHPSVLAAEARVRAAFQLQNAASLDLLPSFQINLLADGGQASLVENFRVWTARVGPSLNIPIYDPSRISALEAHRAEAKIAAAEYRQTVLTTLQEIDSARINLISRRSQLATAEKETQSLASSKKGAHEQFTAGLISQIEYLDTERQWLESTRNQTSLHQAMLEAQLNLLVSTGGGRL